MVNMKVAGFLIGVSCLSITGAYGFDGRARGLPVPEHSVSGADTEQASLEQVQLTPSVAAVPFANKSHRAAARDIPTNHPPELPGLLRERIDKPVGDQRGMEAGRAKTNNDGRSSVVR